VINEPQEIPLTQLILFNLQMKILHPASCQVPDVLGAAVVSSGYNLNRDMRKILGLSLDN